MFASEAMFPLRTSTQTSCHRPQMWCLFNVGPSHDLLRKLMRLLAKRGCPVFCGRPSTGECPAFVGARSQGSALHLWEPRPRGDGWWFARLHRDEGVAPTETCMSFALEDALSFMGNRPQENALHL